MPEASERTRGDWLRGILRKDSASRDEVLDEQQQQLLTLFEKRNELKREFGRTLDELGALKEKHAALLAQHAWCRKRLDGLETLLADPQNSQNAVIYYRLDALWKSCRKLIDLRRQELLAKFEQLEKQKLLENFRTNAVAQQQALERKFAEYDSLYQEMAANLKELQDTLRRSTRPWHYFRRKRLSSELAAAESQVAPVVAQRDECLAELERVRDREPPPFKELSVAAKREINIQLIALAQQLYVHFSGNDLAALSRATQEKHPGETRYGTSQECLAMERPIAEAGARLKSDQKLNDRLKRRSDHLRQSVRYGGNADTVPDPQTLNRIALSLGTTSQVDAVRGDLLVNVLEQGYWNVDQLLVDASPGTKRNS